MPDGTRRRGSISLLDHDPDLAAGVAPDQLELARRRAIARTVALEPPDWDPTGLGADAEEDWLGLFVVDGLLVRSVTVGNRAACELFGPGDLLLPWDFDGEYDPLPIVVEWSVLQRSTLALLDSAFALRVCHWPSITSRVTGRVAQRARYLALTQSITHLPRVHARLLILFWLLAERWGRVGRDGVHVTLPLTHEVLAMLVGSHRPTVTLGLQRLSRAGLLHREGHDRWLVTHVAIERLGQPETLGEIDDDDTALDDSAESRLRAGSPG